MGRRRGIGKWWRRADGVQRSQVNGLGELLSLFCVVILVYSFFFNYTPMEVVHPVGMLVYTAVYTLAADGAVFDTPKKN